jgi:rubrerythrin
MRSRNDHLDIRTVCRNCGYSEADVDPEVKQCPNCGTTYFNLGRRHR